MEPDKNCHFGRSKMIKYCQFHQVKCLEEHLCSYKESHRENDLSGRPKLVPKLQQRMTHIQCVQLMHYSGNSTTINMKHNFIKSFLGTLNHLILGMRINMNIRQQQNTNLLPVVLCQVNQVLQRACKPSFLGQFI